MKQASDEGRRSVLRSSDEQAYESAKVPAVCSQAGQVHMRDVLYCTSHVLLRFSGCATAVEVAVSPPRAGAASPRALLACSAAASLSCVRFSSAWSCFSSSSCLAARAVSFAAFAASRASRSGAVVSADAISAFSEATLVSTAGGSGVGEGVGRELEGSGPVGAALPVASV
eukprot:CAMPEP_0185559960 /NCGR_PEP_ID=MMETSP1381-20130426/55732_1 /TAXON_ID=298111 /ORGANISM="Pavlova sp., Strain CCMP459" /LENGTH=170 /DNA_ID=CAMNT_0028173625 /DNA_START=65 /DNA_END=577 /DNA_ORIENTATION=-